MVGASLDVSVAVRDGVNQDVTGNEVAASGGDLVDKDRESMGLRVQTVVIGMANGGDLNHRLLAGSLG